MGRLSAMISTRLHTYLDTEHKSPEQQERFLFEDYILVDIIDTVIQRQVTQTTTN